MSDVINHLDFWLTPLRRKRIHALAAGLASALAASGLVSDTVAQSWVAVLVSALAVASMILASIKARRVDMTRLYAAVAALIVALRVAGVITDGVQSHWLDIAAAIAAALGPWLAASRTDPSTPTGEPATEYDA